MLSELNGGRFVVSSQKDIYRDPSHSTAPCCRGKRWSLCVITVRSRRKTAYFALQLFEALACIHHLCELVRCVKSARKLGSHAGEGVVITVVVDSWFLHPVSEAAAVQTQASLIHCKLPLDLSLTEPVKRYL